MSHHIPLIRFRLSNGQSIGPTALRRLWSAACGSDDVTVTRETRDATHGSYTYSLCGPPKTSNLALIESRVRRLLAETALAATITLTHHT